MRNYFFMILALLLSTSLCWATPDNDAEDTPPPEPIECFWTDDGSRNICICVGEEDCRDMQEIGICERTVRDTEGNARTVNDFHCPQEYQDQGVLLCQCTSLTALEQLGEGHRPQFEGTSSAQETHEAVRPTEMVPMTGGVMLGDTGGGTQASSMADGSVRSRNVADGSSNTVMLGRNVQSQDVDGESGDGGATLSMTAPRRDHREDASEEFSSVLDAMLSEALRREATVDHRGDGADVPRHSNDEPLSGSGRPNHTVPSRPASLAAPTNLFVAPAGMGELILMWTDNATSEFGVRVERTVPREVRGETYYGWEEAFVSEERVDERVRGTGDRNDVDDGLFSNATYCYRIRAYRGETVSDYSNIACRDAP